MINRVFANGAFAALELGKYGITVNAYAPGPIGTTFRELVVSTTLEFMI